MILDVAPCRCRLAYVGGTNDGQALYTATLRGRDAVDLTHGALTDPNLEQARWSPDGTKIAFAAATGGCVFELWVVNAAGGGLHELMPCADSPAWSPDSKRVAFRRYDPAARRTSLSIADADGSGLVDLAPWIDGDATEIDWSPRGDRIAYGAAAVQYSTERIEIVRADGSGKPTVIRQAAYPVWAPDGHRLAFASHRTGLTVLDVDTMKRRVVDSHLDPAHMFDVSWSSVGTIAYRKDNAVFLVKPGGEPRRLTRASPRLRLGPFLTRNGRYVLIGLDPPGD